MSFPDWSTTSLIGGWGDLSYPDMSQIIKPPAPKWPHFPLLHQFMAERTTTATTADVKNTLHIRWLLHLQECKREQNQSNVADLQCSANSWSKCFMSFGHSDWVQRHTKKQSIAWGCQCMDTKYAEEVFQRWSGEMVNGIIIAKYHCDVKIAKYLQ